MPPVLSAAGSSPGASSAPLRVLIVEDHADLARLFADLFAIMGCVTDVALDVEGGIANARQYLPDLVFCDLRLPGGKDGCDFARELRADPDFPQIPLIAITGSTDASDFERAGRAGFDQVFAKPFKFREIQE